MSPPISRPNSACRSTTSIATTLWKSLLLADVAPDRVRGWGSLFSDPLLGLGADGARGFEASGLTVPAATRIAGPARKPAILKEFHHPANEPTAAAGAPNGVRRPRRTAQLRE